LDYATCLNTNNYLGYNNWRLPNRKELESLVNVGQNYSDNWLTLQGFINFQDARYWSSTTYASHTDIAWSVFICFGYVNSVPKSAGSYVWPVRSRQSGSLGSAVISLPQTGQTTCYDALGNVISCAGTGQDGDIRAGVAWPNPRFTDNGDQTMWDNLTGLTWTKDANAPGPATCGPGNLKTWQGALDYATCLNTNNYLGYNNWRLPNRKELESLVNVGQNYSDNWLTLQGFINFQDASYWSSTTYASGSPPGLSAWMVSMDDGGVNPIEKSATVYNAWPVR